MAATSVEASLIPTAASNVKSTAEVSFSAKATIEIFPVVAAAGTNTFN